MREAGTIIKVLGRKLHIHIHQPRPEACGKCRACEVLGKGGQLVLRTTATGNYHVGQQVYVEIPDVSPWVAIFCVLGLPVFMLVAAMLIGGKWTAWINLVRLDPELAGALLGILAAAATFIIARYVERRYACRIRIHPLNDTPPSQENAT